MKTDKEMAAEILQQVKERRQQQSRNRKRAATMAAIVLVVAAAAAVALWQSGLLPERAATPTGANESYQAAAAHYEPDEEQTQENGSQAVQGQEIDAEPPLTEVSSSAHVIQNGTTAPPPGVPTNSATTTFAPTRITEGTTQNLTTEPPTTQGASAPQHAGDKSGGNIGGVMIPALPQDRTIRYTGEAITDEEAAQYFHENRVWLASALGASGVDADGIRFAESGYCHVSYDGTEGKSFEVRQNFRDYLVWNGDDRLIAIVTLTKENGSLSGTPAFGAPWFNGYNAFLQKHKGEALVFVYAGMWPEMVLTPDGGVFNPQGTDISRYLEGVENPYEIFRCDAATYIP